MPSTPHGHLPRLPEGAYRGHRFVHWTMTIADRRQGWLSPDFHGGFRAILAASSAKYRVVVPAYCLMPDHLHIFAAGLAPDADQQLWARAVRRAVNGLLVPARLQKQAYDHVLRPAERGRSAFAALVHYVCENPVRAGLAAHAREWAFIGSGVPELPGLEPRDPDFSDAWWEYWNSPRHD